ncbi:MAG: hypothetical protein IK083_03285 [Abditibacteriota bacterium]|nr:hypothetical protein [Abditibacteriota bacterium]
MTVTEELRREFEAPVRGDKLTYIYLARGFAEPADTVSRKRANGCRALFSLPEPYIYKNDLICGCLRSIWGEADPAEAEAAGEALRQLGGRSFGTNADHFAPDYRTLVAIGLPGMLERLEASVKEHAGTPEGEYARDMQIAFEGFVEMVRNYAAKAESLVGVEGYDPDRLGFIASNLRALLSGAPDTFARGLQLVWLCHLAFLYENRYAMALGRIDQYLWELYDADIRAGRLTEDRAQELLENVFMKIYELHAFVGGDDVVNIAVGGRDRQGRESVNPLSLCVVRAVGACNVPGPNLSLRYTPGMSKEFVDECLQVIGTGLGYPALMNDDVNIAALSRYGYEPEDVYDYCMVGCIENFITGCQPPWSDNRFDTPKYIEYLFNRGKDPLGIADGPDTGDIDDIRSMQDFMDRYEAQLRAGVRSYVDRFYSYNVIKDPENYTQPFLSCLCRDCIKRGKDINMGGAKYPSVHGAGLMGVGTVADSLAAVEKVVFEDRETDLATLKQALLKNFEGYEALRQKLLAAPKYGNNDEFVDKYAVWFVKFLAGEFAKYRTYDGGGIYIAMASNISNIYSGAATGATPDGRKARAPLSDASSPTYGRDVNGPTATVLSLTKPDYSVCACGSVVNQKFSPDMFKGENRDKLQSLVRAYFARGGQEMQINATSPEVLRDAMQHPENYGNMVVRVSGFSAVYVKLAPEVQEDILHRTQHESAE